MHARKRGVSASDDAILPETKKRSITARTVEKWKTENDKTLGTATWLTYDMADRDHVKVMRCSVCCEFKGQLNSMRNFRPEYIEGSTNLRSSSFKDHAASEMHSRAMILLKKKQSVDIRDYSPIARALSAMDATSKERMKQKFDIAFTISKENMAFAKMKPICELMERHGVDLGEGYKNNQACATFTSYIALEERQRLVDDLTRAKFFSMQADGSTDCGNIEDELFLVVFLDYKAVDKRLRIRNKFFSVRRPRQGDARSLYECLEQAIKFVGLSDEWKMKLIGFGCDGTSVNIAKRGLKMYLQDVSPWIEVFWCLAHRLELALKDALKGTLFKLIDEMLLQVYYLYEKSPKKCRELELVVEELKRCIAPGEFPQHGGHKPLRACGTRFVAHKFAALDRLVDRLGAYLAHLTMLADDPKTKSVDRQRLKGYILKWRNAKMLIGSALFCDILKPSSILCKILQEDDICVVRAIEALLKASQSADQLKDILFHDLPTVKKVLSRISRNDDEGSITYQGIELTNYDGAITFLSSNYQQYITLVQDCLRDRVNLQSTELLTHSLTILATHGWERSRHTSFGYEALDCISTRFLVPLENAGVDCSLLKQEWDDILDYAKRYLNLVEDDYKVIWWKLYNVPDARNWTNILAVVELLFCLPISNGHLERVFSHMKLIKGERRSSLGEDRLDDLLRISVEAPHPSNWNASNAVELWWRDKTRRVNTSDTRATPHLASRPSTSSAASNSDDCTNRSFSTENWESWLEKSD